MQPAAGTLRLLTHCQNGTRASHDKPNPDPSLDTNPNLPLTPTSTPTLNLIRSSVCRLRQAEGEGDYIDLSEHQMVSFRVFGDGRKYIANFRTENWIVGSRNHDVWQAFLFARCGSGTAVDSHLAAEIAVHVGGRAWSWGNCPTC